MVNYRYRARDTQGREVAGNIEAGDEAEARDRLTGQGLEAIALGESGAANEEWSPSGSLSTDESAEITERIAQLSAGQLPLSPGLRAAADEMASPTAATVLEAIADRLDQGESLSEIVASLDGVFPRHVGRLISVASKSGRLGYALSELVDYQRVARDLRWTIVAGLAYPVIVSCLALSVLLCILVFLTGPFDQMFQQFGLEPPLLTRLLFWWRDTGLILMAGLLILAIVSKVIFKKALGQSAWLRVVGGVPFIGSLSRWVAIAQWSRLLSVLIKHQIPLPEALRLAGEGMANDYFGQLSVGLANDVEQGHALSHALSMERQFPATLVPIVRWGEESGMLAETFATSSELFCRRIRTRSIMLRSILPSLLFIVIGSCVLFVVYGLLSPLNGLISGLS